MSATAVADAALAEPTAACVGEACSYAGFAHGEVRVMSADAARRSVWVRNGAAVQCVLATSLLPAVPESAAIGCVAVGDSNGVVSYFHDHCRLFEHALPSAVTALALHADGAGAPAIAAADQGGSVAAFGLAAAQPGWRMRLLDVPALAHLRTASTTALLSLRTIDSACVRRLHLLVAVAGRGLLQLGVDGAPVPVPVGVTGDGAGTGPAKADDGARLLVTTADVSALADGSVRRFTATAMADGSASAPPSMGPTCAVVACTDGAVHALQAPSLALETIADTGMRITALDASQWRSLGVLACCGHFDGVLVVTRPAGLVQQVHVASCGGWVFGALLLRTDVEASEPGEIADRPVLRLRLLTASGALEDHSVDPQLLGADNTGHLV